MKRNTENKKFKFIITHKCPVLLTNQKTVVFADSEDEAVEVSKKSRSAIVGIEKKDVPEDESDYC
jgi:hypothetical protein